MDLDVLRRKNSLYKFTFEIAMIMAIIHYSIDISGYIYNYVKLKKCKQ